MAGDKHLTKADKTYHKKIKKALEDGACLTGHAATYKKNSCSYRYQAVEFSKVDPDRQSLYNKDIKVNKRTARRFLRHNKVKAGYIPTSRYPTNAGDMYPADRDYGDKLKVPQSGDWDVDGPKRKGVTDASGKTISIGKNFTGAFRPYWNNAHHMIPKDLLNARITAAHKDPKIADLIRAGLLKGKYNVNHYINMILLPMDKEVGFLLKLPRHLSLDEGSAEFDDNPKFDHTAYNSKVGIRLRTIMKDFVDKADEVNDKNKKCNISKMPALAKNKLELLSKDCYKSIKVFGVREPGKPLVDLPNLRLKTP
ncbi:AHH domain-containing protein [Archangium violaceum]|uniref:hypothetical protein n=1 Tax=Archangium violaceum TaxID=83451 RepID=UPI002B28FF3C|nr:AHH domain-containing protein [Archangium gephyra]